MIYFDHVMIRKNAYLQFFIIIITIIIRMSSSFYMEENLKKASISIHLSFKEFRSISLARGINWCLLGKSKVDCPSLKWCVPRSCRDSSSDITARLLVRFKSFLRSCVDCVKLASCRPPSLQSIELNLI